MRKKRPTSLLKTAYTLTAIGFFVFYLQRSLGEVLRTGLRVNPVTLALSFALFFLYKLMLASLWHHITFLNGCAIRYRDAVVSYLYSILGKYVPGKVFMLVSRLPAYAAEGASTGRVTVCFFLENVCTLLGAAFLALVSLLFFPDDRLGEYKWIIVGMMAAFFVLIHPHVINLLLRFIEKLSGRSGILVSIAYGQMLGVVFLFVLNWLVLGSGFYLLASSVYPLQLSLLPYVSGVFGLSTIIGILAFFAPSGIGVREGILVFGLGLVIPTEYAVLISVVSRLWTSLAELVLILAAFLWSRTGWHRRGDPPETGLLQKEPPQYKP